MLPAPRTRHQRICYQFWVGGHYQIDAFQKTGGFNENYYAAEELGFVASLKRQGRFVVTTETVITSGRKFRAHSFLTMARLTARLIFLGPRTFRSQHGLEYWYEPKREKAKHDHMA